LNHCSRENKKISKKLPTATFVNPGRSMTVKFTTAKQKYALNMEFDKEK